MLITMQDTNRQSDKFLPIHLSTTRRGRKFLLGNRKNWRMLRYQELGCFGPRATDIDTLELEAHHPWTLEEFSRKKAVRRTLDSQERMSRKVHR
jgi:hypothetical protein